MSRNENQDHEMKPVEIKTVVDDLEQQRLKSELSELQSAIQAKDKTIEFLITRLEKVKSSTQVFIAEDTITKSAPLKCLLAQAQTLVDDIAARENFK